MFLRVHRREICAQKAGNLRLPSANQPGLQSLYCRNFKGDIAMLMRIVYHIVYILMKCALWAIFRLFPFEVFNKLCLFLPGRLVIYGLRYYGACIGENIVISTPLTLHNATDKSRQPLANLQIGKDCYIGRGLFLDIKERVTIEDRVTIAMGVMIISHTDAAHSPLNGSVLRDTAAPVCIRKGAYLGARATILEGVEIGECAVIAAGAVVTKSVPDFTMYGGVPARQIKCLEVPA
jgi:acetyltransferase-like isoleucine patch superfamily enzyme